MQYITITDYPYTSIKTFFQTQEEQLAFVPSQNEPKAWYLKMGKGHSITTRLLNRWDYQLKSYKKTIDEKGDININYAINWDNQ